MKIKLMSVCVMLFVAQQSDAMGNWQSVRDGSLSFSRPSWLSLPSRSTLAGMGAAALAPAGMHYLQIGQNYSPYAYFAPGLLAAAVGAYLNRDAGALRALSGAVDWGWLSLIMGHRMFVRQQREAEEQKKLADQQAAAKDQDGQEQEGAGINPPEEKYSLVNVYNQRVLDLTHEIYNLTRDLVSEKDLGKDYAQLERFYGTVDTLHSNTIAAPWVYVFAAIIARMIINHNPPLVKEYNIESMSQQDYDILNEELSRLLLSLNLTTIKAEIRQILDRAKLGNLVNVDAAAKGLDRVGRHIFPIVVQLLNQASKPNELIEDAKGALKNIQFTHHNLYKKIVTDPLNLVRAADAYSLFFKSWKILDNYMPRLNGIQVEGASSLQEGALKWLNNEPVFYAYAMFVRKYQPDATSYTDILPDINTAIVGVLEHISKYSLGKQLTNFIKDSLKSPSIEVQQKINSVLESFNK